MTTFRTVPTLLRSSLKNQQPRSILANRRITSTTTQQRYASTISTTHGHGGGGGGSGSGIRNASLALVGLFTWTSLIFYVGQQGSKKVIPVVLPERLQEPTKKGLVKIEQKIDEISDQVVEVKVKIGEKVKEGKVMLGEKVEEVKEAIPTSSTTTSPTSSSIEESEQRSNPDDPNSPQTAAFDPETGEINWDCPCLGGMADGPCGPQFKLAFSCFVHSEAEPKGVDCVEKFRGMQECFRQHPDVYGTDDEDDDDGEEFELVQAAEAALALPEEEGVQL